MRTKPQVNRLISLKFTDRKQPIGGLVVDFNDDWTLMKSNPVDYVIDGYVLVRHKNIGGFYAGPEEKFRENVVKLKGVKARRSDAIPLTDVSSILQHLTTKFGLFLLYTKSETACYVGRLRASDGGKLVIDSLDTKGKWDGRKTFRPNDIRVIEFDTDYLNSLQLIVKSRGKKS